VSEKINSLSEIQNEFNSLPYAGVSEYTLYGTAWCSEKDKAARQRAFANFVAGETEWIEADLPVLDEKKLTQSEYTCQALLKQVERREEKVGETEDSEALYEQIARKLAEVYRERESLRTLATDETEKKRTSRERAGHMSQELRGGEVDRTAFHALWAERLQTVLAVLDSDDPTRTLIAKDFLSIAGMSSEEAREYCENAPDITQYERTAETDVQLREALFTIYPGLESAMAPHFSSEPLKACEATPVFQAALDGVGLSTIGWRPRMIPSSTASAESGTATRKEITWGEKRADFDRYKRIETPVHEAFHAVRAQNAPQQPNASHRQKMPGRAFEEGFVDALAQLVSGRRPVIGKLHYINQGLLFGKDKNDDNHLVRTAHDIQKLAELYIILEKSLTAESDIAAAKESARKATYRATRGGPDATDQSYFEGSMRVNPWLNEIAQLPPEQVVSKLRWTLSAQFDPTNGREAALFERAATSQNTVEQA